MKTVEDIRKELRCKYANQQFRGGTVEIQSASFICDEDSIFGTPNKKYIEAEIEWYNSESLNVNDLFKIYGEEVPIWKEVSDTNGFINSNYGYCIYSLANGKQFQQVERTLKKDPHSRQAVMYYTRPSIHWEAKSNGMSDHICTTHVQYFINESRYGRKYIDAHVYMRSNDAVYGFKNDVAWQKHVLEHLSKNLDVEYGSVFWNAGSLHVYERNWNLLC